jgi:hypothetical protein
MVLGCGRLDAPREEEMALSEADSAAGFMAAESPALAEPRPARKRAPASPPVAQSQSPPQPRATPTERKIIRNANLNLEVDSVDEIMRRIKQVVKQKGGYISNETVSEDNYARKTGSVSCRIPADQLDEVLELFQGWGKVENVSVFANDITEQYYDLEVRMANQKALERRLLELLQRQTSKLADLLQIERELARVRTEIDSMEGRKRLWDNQIAYSTVVVYLQERLPVVVGKEGGVWRTLVQSFGRAADNFVLSIAGIIATSGAIIPFVVILLILWLLIRVWKRRRKAEKAKAKAGEVDEAD